MPQPSYLGLYPDIYVGSQRLSEIYAGSNLVWPEGGFIEWAEFQDYEGTLLDGLESFFVSSVETSTASLTINFEDSLGCGGLNDSYQDARARALVLRNCDVRFEISGMVEGVNDYYEELYVEAVDAGYDLDGWWNGPGGISTTLERWASEDNNPTNNCTMYPARKWYSWFTVNSQTWYPIDAGQSIIFWAATNDENYHNNAYYQVNIFFRPR